MLSSDVATLTLVLLMIITALEAQAGNAVVLWLLGFHLHRNAFSIYILNLGGANFARTADLKVVLQKALEDLSEVDGSKGTLPQETLKASGSSLVSRFRVSASVRQMWL
uniref:Uncharacterized protein n=1 Tax=Balaenoptera musculus TaxID=9771 RepID=A0A8C0D135_BALMU